MIRNILMTGLLAIVASHTPSLKAATIDWIPIAGTWQIGGQGGGTLTFQIFLPNKSVNNSPAGTILINGHPGRYVFRQSNPAGGVLHVTMRQPKSIRFKAAVQQQGNQLRFQADSTVNFLTRIVQPTVVPFGLDQWNLAGPTPTFPPGSSNFPNTIPGSSGPYNPGIVPNGPPTSAEAQILQSIFQGIHLLSKN